ncbi:MAG TPA: hypothetical protein VMQ73_24280, partial [Methylomirabilota bacterium]|nr:hypothetical protein [Methylomirabilota bacterium]
MANLITRPSFAEGQILAAASLQGTVDHAIGQQARHERYLHLWGIASGLALTKQDKTAADGSTYVEVTLGQGIAIDGTGREIVVPADTPLDEAAFDNSNVAVGQSTDPKVQTWYPVFLVGQDDSTAAATTATTACGAGGSTAVTENFSI